MFMITRRFRYLQKKQLDSTIMCCLVLRFLIFLMLLLIISSPDKNFSISVGSTRIVGLAYPKANIVDFKVAAKTIMLNAPAETNQFSIALQFIPNLHFPGFNPIESSWQLTICRLFLYGKNMNMKRDYTIN